MPRLGYLRQAEGPSAQAPPQSGCTWLLAIRSTNGRTCQRSKATCLPRAGTHYYGDAKRCTAPHQEQLSVTLLSPAVNKNANEVMREGLRSEQRVAEKAAKLDALRQATSLTSWSRARALHSFRQGALRPRTLAVMSTSSSPQSPCTYQSSPIISVGCIVRSAPFPHQGNGRTVTFTPPANALGMSGIDGKVFHDAPV